VEPVECPDHHGTDATSPHVREHPLHHRPRLRRRLDLLVHDRLVAARDGELPDLCELVLDLLAVMVNTMGRGHLSREPMTMGQPASLEAPTKALAACSRVGHAGAMSRWEAARRGAVTAVLWAVVTFALLACIGEMVAGLHRPAQNMVAGFAEVFHDNMRDAGPLIVAAALLVVSSVTGAVMGLLARRMLLTAVRRVVLLALAALPALWLVVGATWALGWVPRLVVDEPTNLLWLPLGALWFAAIGIVVAAPALVVPAVLAALALEGWTRPEGLPQTGLARPATRRWVLRGLLAAAAALTTFATLNWWRVGAAP